VNDGERVVRGKVLDELGRLCDSRENKRRLSLWERPEQAIRGETQWHGIPNYNTAIGKGMPVTVECLDKVWQTELGLRPDRFFTDPDYYLEHYLRIRLKKYREFPDDTPLTRDIPVHFGVTHEAGLLGQKLIIGSGDEPTFARAPLVDERTELSGRFDPDPAQNPYLEMAIAFYRRVREKTGREFRVIFPQWYRGPQGVALYIRGFENFSLDLHLNPEFAHRLLRHVTHACTQFVRWRSDFTQEPIAKCDLFNDDIPLMSPEFYREFFLPYEQEIADFHGGVRYWHSCGDITKHVAEIQRLSSIDLLDFGVTMEDKRAGMRRLGKPQALEIRFHAQRHVQECGDEEAKLYIRKILNDLRENNIERYVIRSSGMSVLLGAREDIRKLARWVDLVREAQQETPA
jgi:hypothetical protein